MASIKGFTPISESELQTINGGGPVIVIVCVAVIIVAAVAAVGFCVGFNNGYEEAEANDKDSD